MAFVEGNGGFCRLCRGDLVRSFSLRVLGKYDVDYYVCEKCKSLQTTKPFWLAETYSGTLPNLDVGAARRAFRTCSLVLLASTILGLRRSSSLLDFGGGDGLVCRLLRDIGYDAFVYDKYAKNFYADGLSREPSGSYDIVCAIELLEHLADPTVELGTIFSCSPRMVVVGTDRYTGQGSDWPYIGSDHGGHVFFYSKQAMAFIAERYGYSMVGYGSATVFYQGKASFLRRAALALALRPLPLLLGRMWLQLIRPRRIAATPPEPQAFLGA